MTDGCFRDMSASIGSILRSSGKVGDMAQQHRNAMFEWLREHDLPSHWIMQDTTIRDVRRSIAARGVEMPRL